MTLNPGSRLGSYEILALIGRGGMGEVYRARDARLGREVAIKVLPGGVAASGERLHRLEQEARAAAALDHPNILAVYDISAHDGVPYIVSELLVGESLRVHMNGPMPLRRAIAYAQQIAEGLAAAHEKGIVHGDLRPENVFVTIDGRVKLLDFGLARLTEPGVPVSALTGSPTMPIAVSRRVETAAGVVLGTVGYMAPEQIRGAAADHRADLFSFGVVLYEMLTGRRAFAGESAIEVMNGILKEEPAQFDADTVPPAAERLVRHCLEKQPAERFQSARDLAFGLDNLSSRTTTHKGHRHRSPWRLSPVAALTVGGVGLLAGLLLGWTGLRSRGGTTEPPFFQRLTFERGILRAARFADDSGSILYSAAWDGPQLRLYMTKTNGATSTALALPPAHLFSVSRSGELAVSLGHAFDEWLGSGTLARAPLTGGVARQLLENVREAEWTPDGSALAVVRRVDGRDQLEWPIGTVRYATNGYLTTPRFSADGRQLAFGDHPIYGDDDGEVAIIDAQGARKTLAPNLIGLRGVAWSVRGDEVWFSAATDQSQPFASLHAVDLSGRRRTLLTSAVDLALMDISRDGRVLVSGEIRLGHIEALLPGESSVRDFSLFDGSMARTISNGGTHLLITRQGPTSTYLRRTDQSGPIRLGDGEGFDLSQDGQWALSVIVTPPSRVLMLPTGVGDPRQLPNPDELAIASAKLFPDGKHLVLLGGGRGEPWRGYIQDVASGFMRPFTGPGVSYLPSRMIVITNDGQGVALTDAAGKVRLFPVSGDASQPIPYLADDEYPVAWSSDGQSMFVTRGTAPPWRIEQIELATGQRALWKEILPSQNAGLRLSQIAMSADGQAFVHSYSQLLSTLYLVDGLQ